MQLIVGLIVSLMPLLLMVGGLIIGRRTQGAGVGPRVAAQSLAAAALLTAMAGTVLLFFTGPIDQVFVATDWPIRLSLGVVFDGLSAVMLLLIGLIGLVIVRYTVRYLDGEANQGRFFCWLLFTLGAVQAFVLSGNLLLLTLSWMLTNFGLHKLLIHYPERPWAIWAARKKLLISRVGDVMLILALVMAYVAVGSFEYRDLFEAGTKYAAQGQATPWSLHLIGVLLVVGAMTKSAQFPFHSWLPDTMETPTPVSALMHAGVINAGGFLIIRLSPLIDPASFALYLLALVGLLTAMVGGVVMLTQTSVKRMLAYSTVAQMGFMMLQCGLGAYSAAMLHLVAHSLYKAYAFLSSGSVLDQPSSVDPSPGDSGRGYVGFAALGAALLAVISTMAAVTWVSGLDWRTKPGGLALGLILSLAMTHLVWHAIRSGILTVAVRGVLASGVAGGLYVIGWLAMDAILKTTSGYTPGTNSSMDLVLLAIVAIGFLTLFVLQAAANSLADRAWIQQLYVHTVNGFYLDIPARRITAWVWKSRVPTP